LKNNRSVVTGSILKGAAFCRKCSVILLYLFLLFSTIISNAQESILDQKISLADQKITIYEAFTQITDLTGYFFIYDSKLVESDKKVKILSENKPLKRILSDILADQTLDFKVIGKHILIYKKEVQGVVEQTEKKDSLKVLNIKGQIFDKQTKKPLPFVTIGIVEKNIGTVSNYDGLFILRLQPSYLNSTITISHLGYKSQTIPVKLLKEQKVDIFLETEFISIQEVIIRNIDPKEVIRKVYQNRLSNYSSEPIYITSFYREGVLKNSKYMNYSEAILKIFKADYSENFDFDQIKLLKSRKVVNVEQKDTLIVKIKAGLRSCLALDLLKNIPDFLDPEYIDSYSYTKTDIVSINSRNAYAIAFEQKESISEPLYKGTLYIDMESFAVISADFEVNPKYLKAADNLFIIKKSRKYKATPEKISYSVNYNYWNGKYYINHIRSDLKINYKKRYHLLSNDFHVFLELVSCQVDTLNVQRFAREEKFRTNTIFLDSKFTFDETYWGDYNIITPEEKITQALSRNNTKTEMVKPEQ
jgi:hypothetical protein